MRERFRIFVVLLIVAGLILSILSATDLCTFGGCTDAHRYRLYTLPLWLVGIVYFAGYAILWFSRSKPLARTLESLYLAGGIGAEAVFVHIQKNVIEAWCPLCLGIAATVLLISILRSADHLSSRRNEPDMMKRLVPRTLMLLVASLLSFGITLLGMARPDAEAQGLDLFQGKGKSHVTVYVFSDWFCPSCIKAEPEIERAFPLMAQQAKILFVDKPIHPEAMNFVPYHLSFAAREKGKYIQLRRALFELARKTKNPSLEEVKQAVAPLGVTYRQLSFLEVSQSMATFQKLSDHFKVKGTPTVVIVNDKSGKSRTLYGSKEITRDSLLKGIREVENQGG